MSETQQRKAETMTSNQKRIARYEKLLATMRRTEALLIDCELTDGGVSLQRTRQNIATVEVMLAAWKKV